MTDARVRSPADSRLYPLIRIVVGALTPLAKRLLRRSRPPAGLARNVLLLRFRGRRTGRWFETPVGYGRDGDRVTVITLPDRRWPRNVADGADVLVCISGEWRAARARVVPVDDPEFDAAVSVMFRARGQKGLARLGVPVDESGRVPDHLRALVGERIRVVAVRLADRVNTPQPA